MSIYLSLTHRVGVETCPAGLGRGNMLWEVGD